MKKEYIPPIIEEIKVEPSGMINATIIQDTITDWERTQGNPCGSSLCFSSEEVTDEACVDAKPHPWGSLWDTDSWNI